jgi:predicted aspartyl protease
MLSPKKHHLTSYLLSLLMKGLSRAIPVLFTLMYAGCALKAQEEFIPPPSKLITSFPFTTFTGGVMLLKARLDNYPDTLNFVLDTGSGGISVDSATALRLKLTSIASDKTILGIAGIRQVRFIYDQTLHLPGLTVDSLNFHVNDYDILSSVYGDKIDGIIGFSFFSRYIVKIDYDSARVYVYSKGTYKYPKGGHLLKPSFAGLPIQSALVRNGRNANGRFYFDTGAGLCLLLSSDFAQDSGLMIPGQKVFYTQAEGLGGKASMRLTTVKEVKVGPYKFHKVPAYIFDDDYNVTSYPNLGGLLGNDLFRRFNVTLNYEHREIYLVPNSHFRDVFDYSYSGLSLYLIDGQVVIGDVMKNSPAEKAGFRADDVVVALNNNFSQNIQVYKGMLQSTGEKIIFLLKRKGQLSELSLRVKSIL